MNCKICGRKLRNTASAERGYGPVCYKRTFGHPVPRIRARQKDKDGIPDVSDEQIPGQMDIFAFLSVETGRDGYGDGGKKQGRSHEGILEEVSGDPCVLH